MVGGDDRDAGAQVAVKGHQWAPDGGPVGGRIGGVGPHDDSVHHMSAEHVDVLIHILVHIDCGTEDGAKTVLVKDPLQAGRECSEEGVTDRGHDDPDDVSPVAVEIPGQLVGYVVKVLHGRMDPGLHLVRDVAGTVDHQGDCADRNPRGPGDIAHTNHSGLPSFQVSPPGFLTPRLADTPLLPAWS